MAKRPSKSRSRSRSRKDQRVRSPVSRAPVNLRSAVSPSNFPSELFAAAFRSHVPVPAIIPAAIIPAAVSLRTADAEFAFARRYIVDNNGTRSVLECGAYGTTNYMAAAQIASRLLRKPRVQQLIKDARAERLARWEISGDRIIREMARVGFSNMLDYIHLKDDGTTYVDLRRLKQLQKDDPEAARDLGAAIQEVTSEVYLEGNGKDAVPVKKVKLRLHGKQSALDKLGEHLGLFDTSAKRQPPNVTFNVTYTQNAGRNRQLLNDVSTDNGKHGQYDRADHVKPDSI